MPNITIASNASQAAGKWLPYYYKPFLLGTTGNADGTDGQQYITQTVGGSDVEIQGSCTSDANTGYYYILEFLHGTSDYFYVRKYDLGDNLIDRIYASDTGAAEDGNWWSYSSTGSVTIDVGVSLYLTSTTGFASADEYKIELPTADQMNRRKIYHGGYSSFLRMPYAEGVAFHSDIFPTSLKNKNVSIVFAPPDGLNSGSAEIIKDNGNMLALSKELLGGNNAVSLSMEWQVNKDSRTSANATDHTRTDFEWGTGETWQLGTIFGYDMDPRSSTDMPIYSSATSSDLDYSLPATGLTQHQNISVSGRAGYVRFKTEFMLGTGSGTIAAHNQFWPIIIMIS